MTKHSAVVSAVFVASTAFAHNAAAPNAPAVPAKQAGTNPALIAVGVAVAAIVVGAAGPASRN